MYKAGGRVGGCEKSFDVVEEIGQVATAFVWIVVIVVSKLVSRLAHCDPVLGTMNGSCLLQF